MDSFTGKTIRIRVAKKADKINENLLSDGKEAEEGGLWQTISRYKQTDKLTNRQTHKQTDPWRGRVSPEECFVTNHLQVETDRQTYKQTDTQTD